MLCGGRSRKLIALQFLGRGEWVNTSPKQINEYAAGFQRSQAVEFAWKLYGTSQKTSASVPLMRAALIEKVAEELYAFLVSKPPWYAPAWLFS